MSRIEEFFEKSVDAGIIPQIPMNYDAVAYKIYAGYLENKIDELTAEVAELTKWKERAEKAEGRLEKLKKTDGDLTIEDEINMLENIVEEARHRSFVFERELVKYKIAFDKAIKLAYKIRTDFDVLSCSSCEFGYATDVCKKTGLYSDCENRWKEELLQQAEHEIEGEKENTLKEGDKCSSPLPSAGYAINPIDVLRDSTKCITIAERALENIVKQYWCAERGCNECEEKQGCIEGICSRYIQQAEREIEEGKI